MTSQERDIERPARKLWAALLALVGLLAAPAWAQEGDPPPAFDPPIVERIVVEGARRYTESQLVAALGQAVGRPVDERAIARGIEVLWETFRVRATVSYKPAGPDSIELLLSVDELPLDLEPRFIGNVEVDTDELLEWARLTDESEVYLHEAPRIRARLLEGYRREGFYHAEVRVVERPGGVDDETGQPLAPDVIFEIKEGPKVKVSDVVLHGNESLPDRGFVFRRGLSKLAGVELRGPRLFGLFGKAFVRETLDADLIAMRQVYRDTGFLDAVVELQWLEFNEERDRVTIHVAIDEGEPYTVGSLAIEAIEHYGEPDEQGQYARRPAELVFPEAELLELVELEPGEVYARDPVRADERALRSHYGGRGYIDHPSLPDPVRWQLLDPILVFEEDRPVVHVTYVIAQGSQQFIREVKVSGNLHTQDRVIRREIEVEPGEVADIETIVRSRNRIEATGYFSDPRNALEHREPTFRFLETGDPSWKDLEFIVEEGEVLTFAATGGVSSNGGAFGLVAVGHRNFDATALPSSPWSVIGQVVDRTAFHGAGQELQIQVSPGTQVSFFDVRFSEPDLFGTHYGRIGATLQATKRFRRFESHDEERLQYGLQLSRQLGIDSRAFLGYRFEEVEIDDLDPGGEPTLGSPLTVPAALKAQEGLSDLGHVEFGYRLRTIDNRINPRNGLDFVVSNQLHLGATGSDFDFVRSEVGIDVYREFDPLADVSDRWHLGLRAGVAFPFGDTDEVPYSERFFLGGQRYMRGFDFRGVGPNEEGYPIGGQTLLFGTFEVRRPLVTTNQPGTYREIETVQGGLFVDAGIVDPDEFSITGSEFRVSAGFLFGISVPIPITFSFGFPIIEGEGDDRQLVGFSIGF